MASADRLERAASKAAPAVARQKAKAKAAAPTNRAPVVKNTKAKVINNQARNAPVRPMPAPTARLGSSRTGAVSALSGGGDMGGAFAAMEAPMEAPAAPVLSDDDYLAGDTSYQSQMSALQRALADFESQSNTAAAQYDTNLVGQRASLGKARTQGFADLENDFASRNMLQSGLYGTSFGELGQQFDQRSTDLDQGKTNFDTNRGIELGNFKTEQQLTTERARAEAIARRASSFAL